MDPKKLFFAILLLGFLSVESVFLLPAGAFAAEDDLNDALKDGKKTIQFSGKESDDIKIRKGVSVIGTSPDKAIINGDVTMENGSSLQNVTVNGKVNAVTVEKGASATLINVSLRGASAAGIYAPGGGGTLTMKNSRIFKNQKGLYVLSGKAVSLTGNSITENKEEGADFHSSISGTISGNTFSQNGEGGMEIIINGSSITLSGNTFSGNKASGLALQTYKGEEKTGKFSVLNNTFSGNGNFGIDCKNPQGSGNAAYFLSSVTATGNSFPGNKIGYINPLCRFANQAEIPKEEKAEEGKDTGTTPLSEEAPGPTEEQKLEEQVTLPTELPTEEPQEKEISAPMQKDLVSARTRFSWQSFGFLKESPLFFLFPSAWREKIGGFLSSVHW